MILAGRVWFQVEDQEHVAEVGDLVFKPRGGWHTSCAADDPAPMLELISPCGLEQGFKIVGTAVEDVYLGPLVAPYGCEADMNATAPIIERFGLTFG